MKKLFLFAVLLMMAGGVLAQNAEEGKTLYIVDGSVVSESVFKEIPTGVIKNMNVVKGVESVVIASTEDAGRKVGVLTGKVNDVETVILEGDNNAKTEVSVIRLNSGNRDETTYRVRTKEGANPVVLVTDAKGKTTQVKDILAVKAETIESMTILKSEQAKSVYGDKYGDLKDGVILINLKGKEQEKEQKKPE